jgi:hypothetical protein
VTVLGPVKILNISLKISLLIMIPTWMDLSILKMLWT